MSKSRIRWDWKKQKRDVQKLWKELAPRHDEHLDVIEDSLKNDHASLLSAVVTNLGTDIARRGMARIFGGEAAGWSDIHTGWKYESWHAQVIASEGKYKLWEDIMAPLARVLAGAIALGEIKYARWCGSVMLKNHRNPTNHYDPFQVYMVTLFARWQGQEAPLKGWKEKQGPYAAVFADWKGDLSGAISAIADYHCRNSKHLGEGVFWRHPDTAFPAEILALYKVRADLALDTPTIEHPLLDQPLAKLPSPFPKAKPDKLLARVVQRCQELDPQVKDVQRTFWNA